MPETRTHYETTLNLESHVDDYASIPVTVDYFPECVLLTIPDVENDNGIDCNSNEIFWQSPGIVIRNQDDGQYISQRPLLGTENTVYVNIHNYGAFDSNANISLKFSASVFGTSNSASWQVIGEQMAFIPSDSELWLSFSWIPQSENGLLRAEVSAPDAPLDSSQTYPCNSQVAQRNSQYLLLNNFSWDDDIVSGYFDAFIFSDTILRPYHLPSTTEISIPNVTNQAGSIVVSTKSDDILHLAVQENDELSGLALILEYAERQTPTSEIIVKNQEIFNQWLPLIIAGIFTVLLIFGVVLQKRK